MEEVDAWESFLQNLRCKAVYITPDLGENNSLILTTMSRSTPSDPQAAALLAHVVSQMQQNVDFLVAQNYITQADASAIVSKLPNSSANRSVATAPLGRVGLVPPPPAPGPRTFQARALWAYNENGQVSISYSPFIEPSAQFFQQQGCR